MTEHYTANTESVSKWCNHCGRNTQHGVSAGRVGRCLEHDAPKYSKRQLENQKKAEKKAANERQNPGLFDNKKSVSESLHANKCEGCEKGWPLSITTANSRDGRWHINAACQVIRCTANE
jgi:hypothetical protein